MDELSEFKLNLILLHDIYSNNENFINKKAQDFVKKYHEFSQNKDKNIEDKLYQYAKETISYSLFQDAITQMYHLFDQYIRIYYKIDFSEQNFESVIKEAKDKYNYDLKSNSYFNLVNKYRLLNNAIKHGNLHELEKNYNYLINNGSSDNKYGTILDSNLNITNNEVDECCSCLSKYVEEMQQEIENS